MQHNKEYIAPFSPEKIQEVSRRYKSLQKELTDLPWILQGSVVETPPKSPTARATYIWTRKVRAKTITVSLSPEQAIAFRSAIEANRRVETALIEMRATSQDVLMNSLPRARKRSASRTKTQRQVSS